MAVPRNPLFEVWLKSNNEEKHKAMLNHILSVIGRDVDHLKLKQYIMRLSHDIRMRWERCGRSTKIY